MKQSTPSKSVATPTSNDSASRDRKAGLRSRRFIRPRGVRPLPGAKAPGAEIFTKLAILLSEVELDCLRGRFNSRDLIKDSFTDLHDLNQQAYEAHSELHHLACEKALNLQIGVHEFWRALTKHINTEDL
jgi:hypothetical protein